MTTTGPAGTAHVIADEQRAYGDFLDKDARYERTGEFLQVVRELWQGPTVGLDGRHVHVE